MLTRLLCVCLVLSFASAALAVDTLYFLPAGVDPDVVTGDTTVAATWNGAGYDDIVVLAWFRDIGATSEVEGWVGYQVAFDNAIPTVGCTGDITKQTGTLVLERPNPRWLLPTNCPTVFTTSSDADGYPAVAGAVLLNCPTLVLGDEAAYLAEVTYDIASGTSGTWRLRPRCTEMEDCVNALHCRTSHTLCEDQSDCPRYTVLGDAADTCDLGISPDTETMINSDIPNPGSRAEHDVFELLIEIPVGQCCDGVTCLGVWTEEDCVAVPGAVFTPGNTCDDPCMCQGSEDCYDGDACTDDVCGGNGQCTNPINYNVATECCNSDTGVVLTIDDDNECTIDTCESDGSVTYTYVPWGTETAQCLEDAGETPVDDGCTLNICDGQGACEALAIGGMACDDEVFTEGACLSPTYGTGGTCEDSSNTCVCSSVPSLRVSYTGGSPNDESCFGSTDEVYATVSMTSSARPILAAHVNVAYDPQCLSFGAIEPAGAVFDEWTPPFGPPVVDEDNGLIEFEVWGGWTEPNATTGPEDLAMITFTRRPDCDACEVCVVEGENPRRTALTEQGGVELLVPDLSAPCSPPIRFNGRLHLNVPEDDGGNLLCDEAFAVFTWDAPTASHACISHPPLNCACESFTGTPASFMQSDCEALVWGGGEFPRGTFVFECTTQDDCGDYLSASWTITVSDLTTVVAEVELQPLMATDGLFTRCIVFELFPDCVQPKQVVMIEMDFGDWDSPVGHATSEFDVTGGFNFDCVTARDPFHTLRSVVERETVHPISGPLRCADGKLMATFKSTHSQDYWLIAGNLDGNDRIDIIDFGILVAQYNTAVQDIDDHCGSDLAELGIWEGYPDADMNSDGLVDLDDFTFIANNYLAMSKDSCCPDPTAGTDVPLTSVTVAQLELMGLGYLAVADRNGDGRVDTEDMVLVMNGDVPRNQIAPKVRGGTRIRSGR